MRGSSLTLGKKMTDLSHGLSGASGEFYAAAELSRRRFIATITSRNAEGIDILAAKPGSGRAIKIQVKTIQGATKRWVLREKNESECGEGHFYIFVRLGALGSRPTFHIVPGKVVAETIKAEHAKWVGGLKRDGTNRKNGSMRKFSDKDGAYLEKWDLLEEKPNQALEPTTTAVTPRAGARVAPSVVVAHL
jgi:hypothetical protein